MPDKPGYFNVEEFNKQKWRQNTLVGSCPEPNVIAAAHFCRSIFEKKDLTYGFLGSFAMLCLGQRRAVPDVHIAYEDKDFIRIKGKLERHSRIRLPYDMTPLFPFKVLVRTGPSQGDKDCKVTADVEVNFLPPGSHDTPSTGMLGTSLVLLSLKPDGKLKTYKGLNLLHLVRTTLQLCKDPDISWSPQGDILYLCRHYAADLRAFHTQLDRRELHENFLRTKYFSQLSMEDQRNCYLVLQGAELPQKSLAPASQIQQTLQQSPQTSPNQAPFKAPGHATSISYPVELSATPLPQSQLKASELPAATYLSQDPANAPRDSRARYRGSSVPNSRNTSPQSAAPIYTAEPMPQASQHLPLKSAGLPYNAQPVNVQNQVHITPRNTQYLALAPISLRHQMKKSMPNLNAGFQNMVYEMSATPAPYNPGQDHMKAKLGLSAYTVPPISQTQNHQSIVNNPVPPNLRTAHVGSQLPKVESAFVSELESLIGSTHVATLESAVALSRPVPVPSNPLSTKLQIVENEGVYPAPLNHSPPQKEIGTSPQFVAELDSCEIVRNISADIDDELTLNENMQTQPPAAEQSQIYTNTPAGISDSQVPPPTTQPTHFEPARPQVSRIQSNPAFAFPASLMVGGQNPRRPQRASSNSPPRTNLSNDPQHHTNVSRYSQYIVPTASTNQACRPSKYKAYQPPSELYAHPQHQVNAAPHPLQTQFNLPHLPSPILPTPTSADESSLQSLNFAPPQDVEGADTHLRTHRRNASHDSHASSASNGSEKLAVKCRAEMPKFEGEHEGDKTVVKGK